MTIPRNLGARVLLPALRFPGTAQAVGPATPGGIVINAGGSFGAIFRGSTGVFVDLPNPPSGRDHPNIWIDDNDVAWLVGGFSGSTTKADVYSLDLSNPVSWVLHGNSWGTATAIAESANTILKYGGSRSPLMVTIAGLGVNATSRTALFWSRDPDYDVGPDVNNVHSTIPAARADLMNAGVHLKGRLYVAGGNSAGGTEPQGLATNSFYSITALAVGYTGAGTHAWETMANLPRARRHHNVVTDGDRLYIFAGFTSGGSTTSVVDVYDPDTETWSTLTAIPATGQLPGFHWNNRLFLLANSVVYEYDLAQGDAGSWANTSATRNPDALTFFSQGAIGKNADPAVEAGNDTSKYDPASVAVDTLEFATGGTTAAGGTSVTVNAPAGRLVGDTLYAVVTTVSGQDAATFTGWTQVAFNSGSHRSWLLRRAVTEGVADNLTFNQGVSTAIAVSMCLVRNAPLSSFWHDLNGSGFYADGTHPFGPVSQTVGLGPALMLSFVSVQCNSGVTGVASEWASGNGNLLCDAWGGRPTFKGVSNAIGYKTGVGSQVTVSLQINTSGSFEYGTVARYLAVLTPQA